jgi:hypothetical protein
MAVVVTPFQSFHWGGLIPHTVPISMIEFLKVRIDKELGHDYESATANKATISGGPDNGALAALQTRLTPQHNRATN